MFRRSRKILTLEQNLKALEMYDRKKVLARLERPRPNKETRQAQR